MSPRVKVFVCILCVIAAAVLILLSPVFSITEININTVSLYSPEDIESSLGGMKGSNGFISLLKDTSFSNLDNIFRLRFGNLEQRMLFQYPLARKISVKYSPPHTLNVEIEERDPILVAETDGIYLYIDSEGYLLGTYTQDDMPDMPVVEGIEITEYKIGRSIAGGRDKTVDEAIKICSTMEQLSMLSYIDIIDISDYNNIWMYCVPSLSIKFGSTEDTGRKLSYIKGIIDSGYDGNSDGTLDMSTGGDPVFKAHDYTAGDGEATHENG